MDNSGELLLESGRKAQLAGLDQYLTNEGWLLGYPTSESNREDVKRLVERLTDSTWGEPYLITPVEKPLGLPEGVHCSWGTPAVLPGVTCIARFQSDRLERDADGYFSGLRVIWLQDDFAFPIDPQVLPYLEAIDWEAHAVPMEF